MKYRSRIIILVVLAMAVVAVMAWTQAGNQRAEAAPGAVPACHVYTATGLPKPISNQQTDILSSAVQVTDTGYVHSISVHIDTTTTYAGALRFWLTDNTNAPIDLATFPGSSVGGTLTDVIFTDGPATPMMNTSQPPYTGSYNPETSPDHVNGNAAGTWTLHIKSDNTTYTYGDLTGWSLTVCTDSVTATVTNTPTPTVTPTKTPVLTRTPTPLPWNQCRGQIKLMLGGVVDRDTWGYMNGPNYYCVPGPAQTVIPYPTDGITISYSDSTLYHGTPPPAGTAVTALTVCMPPEFAAARVTITQRQYVAGNGWTAWGNLLGYHTGNALTPLVDITPDPALTNHPCTPAPGWSEQGWSNNGTFTMQRVPYYNYIYGIMRGYVNNSANCQPGTPVAQGSMHFQIDECLQPTVTPTPSSTPTRTPTTTATATPTRTPYPTRTPFPYLTDQPGVQSSCYGGTQHFSEGAFRCWNPMPEPKDNPWPDGMSPENYCVTSYDHGTPYEDNYSSGQEVYPDANWYLSGVEFALGMELDGIPRGLQVYIYDKSNDPDIWRGNESEYVWDSYGGPPIAVSDVQYGGYTKWLDINYSPYDTWFYDDPIHFNFSTPVRLKKGGRYWIVVKPAGSYQGSGYRWPDCYDWISYQGSEDSPNGSGWPPLFEAPSWVLRGQITCEDMPNDPEWVSNEWNGCEVGTRGTNAGIMQVPIALYGTTYGPEDMCYTIKPDNLANQLQFFWWDEWPTWDGSAMPAAGTVYLKDPNGIIIDRRSYQTPARGNSWAATSWTEPSGTWWSYPPSPGHSGDYALTPANFATSTPTP